MKTLSKILVTFAIFWFIVTPECYGQKWEKTDGPYGGNLNFIATKANSIFCGTSQAGIFYSSDFGQTWESRNNGLNNKSVLSYAIENSVIYVGTRGGVFKSDNNGISWLNIGLTQYTVNSLVSKGNVIAAGVMLSIPTVFISLNGGQSWNISNLPLSGFPIIIDLEILANNNIVAGTPNGIFTSTNNGSNWSQTYTGNGINTFLNFSSSQVIAGGGLYVLRSLNNGLNWQVLSNTNTGDVEVLAKSSTGILYCGTQDDGLLKSVNNGVNWAQLSNYPSNSSFALNTDESGFIYSSAFFGGLCRSADEGTSWTFNNQGLSATATICFAVNNSNDVFCGTFGSGLFKSTNSGTQWNLKGILNEEIKSIAINTLGHLYVGTDAFLITNSQGGIFRSTNSGESWSRFLNSPSILISCIDIDSQNNIFVSSLDNGVFFSSNNGANWNSRGLTASAINVVRSLGNNIIYCGTQNGLFRSTNNGLNWSTTQLSSNYITSFYQSHNGDLFAGTSSGLFLSTNQGSSWNQTNSGLNGSYISSINQNSSGHLFLTCGTDPFNGIIFKSSNNGSFWNYFSAGLQNISTNLSLDSSGFLYAATSGDGAYKTIQSTTFIASNNVALNSETLYQNYPNPFNPTTKISFNLPRVSIVNLEIFDMNGKKIESLISEKKMDGLIEVNWSPSIGLSTGIYFCRLKTSFQTFTKTLVLLR